MECIEIYWLCKHQKDQKQPTSHACTELSETPVFLSIVKQS